MKTKISLLLILLAIFTQACKNSSEELEIKPLAVETENLDTLQDYKAFNYDTLKGLYIGKFGKEDIKIILTYVSDAHVAGYNLLKGLQRNIKGNAFLNGDKIKFLASEPGDNPYDGVFEFEIDPKTFKLIGTWKPNDTKLKSKQFSLDKLNLDADYKDLNSANFANYFYMVGDSLGYYNFEDDGYCSYEYYPEEKGTISPQMKRFVGSWSLTNNVLQINWKKNDFFKDLTEMTIIKTYYEEDDYTDFILLNDKGDTLYPILY